MRNITSTLTCLFLLAGSVHAAYWTSSDPGNWKDGSNWNIGAQPPATADVQFGVATWHGTATIDANDINNPVGHIRGSSDGNPEEDYTFLIVTTDGVLDASLLQQGYYNRTDSPQGTGPKERFLVSGGTVTLEEIQDSSAATYGGNSVLEVTAGSMTVAKGYWTKGSGGYTRETIVSGTGQLEFLHSIEANGTDSFIVSGSGTLDVARNGLRWYSALHGPYGTVTISASDNATITAHKIAEFSIQSGSETIVNVSGNATVDFKGGLRFGYASGSTATMNISGGTVTGTTMGIGWNAGASATVNLTGGTLAPDSLSILDPGGLIDITGGQILLPTDWSAWVTNQVTDANSVSGGIIAFGGSGTVVWDYGVTNAGMTTITATNNLLAKNPSPANGATDVPFSGTILTWDAGDGATSHDVYFGADDPGNLAFQGNQAGTSFDSGDLSPSKTYFWRIDEQGNGAGTGLVWSFGAQVIACDPPLLADTNGDCVVDLLDFAQMGLEWLSCNWTNPAACN